MQYPEDLVKEIFDYKIDGNNKELENPINSMIIKLKNVLSDSSVNK
jgi:hypothetical protein